MLNRLRIAYPLTLTLCAFVLSGDYGTTATASLGSRYPVADDVTIMGAVSTTWADEEHMSNRFGVNRRQSIASGYKQYDAESGIKSVGFTVGATYDVTEQWSANATLRADQLLSEASDSPVVKDDFAPAVFVTTSYKF